MKTAWNTSTLPAALDGPTATVIYTERTPTGPARVTRTINRKPTERTLALDNSLYTDTLKGAWKHRTTQRRQQENLGTWMYAAGTILCFAAIGLMLAWRG